MKEITMYRCDFCGSPFSDKDYTEKHEQKHIDNEKANQMLSEGKTLGEINSECHVWNSIPHHMTNVTKDNCFVISHWQCCQKPAYQIQQIGMNGKLFVSGAGSWSGSYGDELGIQNSVFEKSYPKEDLYAFHKGVSNY